MRKKIINCILIVWYLLSANTTFAYTHADTLRGSNGSGRAWWDVMKYELSVSFDTAQKSIKGSNIITLKVTGKPTDSCQIDLQDPMKITRATCDGKPIDFVKDGNVWWLRQPFH